MNTRRIKKQSYSMREVSQITSLKAYVLRYWETEFEELRPRKDRHGNRSYRMEDIKLIFHLKKLLYEDEYTIAGARRRLKALEKSGRQMDFSFERLRQEDAVFEIKKGLHEILTLLDKRTTPETPQQKVVVVAKRKQRKTSPRLQLVSVPTSSESAAANGMFFSSDPIADH
ncbi:MAG: MerR family transcriptional regulator [candidate division KSB1 bacterium]